MIPFEENISLVYKVFNDCFSESRYIEDDLIQEGMIGLLKACRTYTDDQGAAFSTYAYTCIRMSMLQYAMKEGQQASLVVSMQQPRDAEGDLTYEDTLQSEETAPPTDNRQKLQAIFDIVLDDRQRTVLLMKLEGWPQCKIAERLHLSQVAVSEAFRAATTKVRRAMNIEEPAKRCRRRPQRK